MARFDIGGYTRYNTGRMSRGRAPIRPSTFKALEDVGIHAKDMEGWIAGSAAVRVAKLVKASELKDYWQSIAPTWGDHDPRGATPPTAYGSNSPGDYKKSIRIMEKDGTVAVGSTFMPLAGWLEYGTSKMAESAPGRQTLEHFGGGAINAAERITDKLFLG